MLLLGVGGEGLGVGVKGEGRQGGEEVRGEGWGLEGEA